MRGRKLLGLLVGVTAVAGLVMAQVAVSAKPTKTTICHRAMSAKKPYVELTVTKSVLRGHVAHPGDIIPAPAECPTTVLTAKKGGKKVTATLTGAAEVPGPGDTDGAGTATLRLRPNQGQICHSLIVTNVMLPALAAHIHAGAADVAGPVVVPLTAPDADGNVQGCGAADRALVKAILQHPSAYYVNVHTADFPAGAVRDQLG